MTAPRGGFTGALWGLLWLCAGVLLGTEALDAWRRDAPLPVWVIKLLPVGVLLPWVARDRLRAVIWVCFVCLLYFVAAVQRLFAEPSSPRAVVELVAVVGLFATAMLYVRQRARELRAHHDEESA